MENEAKTSEHMRKEILARNMTHLLPEEPQPVSADVYDGYRKALECAGAKVLDKEEFGSYQGEWWAQIQLPDGSVFFVNGHYGSCSGCDAFEGEFGWSDDERPDYPVRLRDFGRDYIESCYTKAEAIQVASKNLEWDHDAAEMVAWISTRAEAGAGEGGAE